MLILKIVIILNKFSKKSDCHEKLSENYIKDNYAYCCYAESEEGEKWCSAIDKVTYDNLESLNKAAKELR